MRWREGSGWGEETVGGGNDEVRSEEEPGKKVKRAQLQYYHPSYASRPCLFYAHATLNNNRNCLSERTLHLRAFLAAFVGLTAISQPHPKP